MNGLIGVIRRPAFWLAGAGIAGATGLAVGNEWIAGATVITLLIAAAPCLVMCVLGLCMKGGGASSCRKGKAGAPTQAGDADP